LYNASPKIREGALTKKIGAKTCKISVDFKYITSDFDREYLRNDSRYPNLKEDVSTFQIFLLHSTKKVW